VQLFLFIYYFIFIFVATTAVAELEKIVHNNEYRARTAAGHP
jgi:hypothetical protein